MSYFVILLKLLSGVLLLLLSKICICCLVLFSLSWLVLVKEMLCLNLCSVLFSVRLLFFSCLINCFSFLMVDLKDMFFGFLFVIFFMFYLRCMKVILGGLVG